MFPRNLECSAGGLASSKLSKNVNAGNITDEKKRPRCGNVAARLQNKLPLRPSYVLNAINGTFCPFLCFFVSLAKFFPASIEDGKFYVPLALTFNSSLLRAFCISTHSQ
jgi:hypothetical protein